jgi:hypothetical protein
MKPYLVISNPSFVTCASSKEAAFVYALSIDRVPTKVLPIGKEVVVRKRELVELPTSIPPSVALKKLTLLKNLKRTAIDQRNAAVGPLNDASPNCWHVLDMSLVGGKKKCLKCGGWYIP